jgi:SAM-dependent methyltransferase
MKPGASLAIFLAVTGCAGLLAGPAAAQSPHTHQHSFSGAEQWAHVFDDQKRDDWQKPHAVIQALALKPDAVVADIGSGTGYFAVRFANMVPRGHVYGVDIEPDMVKYLAGRAHCDHRFPHGFPRGSAEGGAHCAGPRHRRAEGRGLLARDPAPVPAQPVFPGIPACDLKGRLARRRAVIE